MSYVLKLKLSEFVNPTISIAADAMDVNIFTEMLRGLNTRDDSIKSTADYCWRNRVSAEDFIRVIEKEMLAAKK